MRTVLALVFVVALLQSSADSSAIAADPVAVTVEIERGGAADGPGARDTVKFIGFQGFRGTTGTFDPRAQDVTFTVTAGHNVRAITVPAGDARWKRRKGGGYGWTSPARATPRWKVGFGANGAFWVILTRAGLADPLEHPFAVDLLAGDEQGTDDASNWLKRAGKKRWGPPPRRPGGGGGGY